jgi:hypothetical protein
MVSEIICYIRSSQNLLQNAIILAATFRARGIQFHQGEKGYLLVVVTPQTYTAITLPPILDTRHCTPPPAHSSDEKPSVPT